jgi:hypothetical protein
MLRSLIASHRSFIGKSLARSFMPCAKTKVTGELLCYIKKARCWKDA